MISSEFLFALLISASLPLVGAKPMLAERVPGWARGATHFDKDCLRQPQRIVAPDPHIAVEISCRVNTDGDLEYSLRVRSPEGTSSAIMLGEGAKELLWAPNSMMFYINSGFSSYSGFTTILYERKGNSIKSRIVTQFAQRDMVDLYPPCKAWFREVETCADLERNPEYNMSALGWSKDSSSVMVFAEIPSSSSYGGIMGQIEGYRLSSRNGTILERLTGPEMSVRWRTLFDWKLTLPPAPRYGSPQAK